MSTVTLSEFLACLAPISNLFDAFRIEKLESARSLREVRLDIEKHRLSLTGETGMAIGKIARALNLREYLLLDFIQLVIEDWKIKDPKRAKNKDFVHRVRQGFKEGK